MGPENSEYIVTNAHYFSLNKVGETLNKFGVIQKVNLTVVIKDNNSNSFKGGIFEIGIPKFKGRPEKSESEVNTLIEDDLGFCLSEVVYWVNSEEFENTSISRMYVGIKNPNGFYFDFEEGENSRHVKIKSIEKGLTNHNLMRISGNIRIRKGNIVSDYSFVFNTNSSGIHKGN